MVGIKRLLRQKLNQTKFGEILRHAKNFFLGKLATKGLGLISMPVFTRLLSEKDYGIVAVCMASIGILSKVITLNASNAVSRYYYEKEHEDFPVYLSSLLQFQGVLVFIAFIGLFLFQGLILDLLNLPSELVYFLAMGIFFLSIKPIYQQFLVATKQSRPYVWVNVSQSYGGFGLSWALLLIFHGAGYFLRLAGVAVTQLITGFWMLVYIIRETKFKQIIWRHISYSLKFALPRMPYVLSATLLAQFDRMMLSSMASPEAAGLYHVGYNVGMLPMLAIQALTPAFLPNFYQLMNQGRFKQVNNINVKIFWIVTGFAIAVMFLGYPLIYIMADSKFHEAEKIVPLVVLGYVFFGLAGVYNRFIGYYKDTILQSIAAVLAAGVNVILNYWLIPIYGIEAAAIATVIAYAVQALVSWILISWRREAFSSPINLFLIPLVLNIMIGLLVIFYL
jgi:O-antigen/teichoic acid export membrane protein